MSQAATTPYVPLEDYFEREAAAGPGDDKHEWSDGVVYAMLRGTLEHGRLSASATMALGAALRRDCRPYGSETMLYVHGAKLSTYADLTIVCGPAKTRRVQKNGRSHREDAAALRGLRVILWEPARTRCHPQGSSAEPSITADHCPSTRTAGTWLVTSSRPSWRRRVATPKSEA